jgi:threonine dehydrogenase-like Zn-dependent dehydrogenase
MGGVGLMALKLARVRLLSTIICLDIDDTKLNMARVEGAHYTFNTLVRTHRSPRCLIDQY